MEPTIFHTNVVLLQVHCFDNNLHLFWTNKELLVIRFDMQMREGRGTLEPNNSFLCWNIGNAPGSFLKLSYLDVCERFTIERCLGNHMYICYRTGHLWHGIAWSQAFNRILYPQQ